MPLIATRGAASAQGFGEFAQSAAVNYIEDVFSTYLYTADGSSTQTINNGIDLSGKGGLVWIKSRSNATGHVLVDTVRGSPNVIQSNNTNAQASWTNEFGSFLSTGFTVPYNTIYGETNFQTRTYCSWTFREQPKFFDVVTYTGNGTGSRDIAHNLGSVPGCVIIKRTDSTSSWAVWHRGNGVSAVTYFDLNTTAAGFSDVAYTAFTSATTFTVDGISGATGSCNTNGATYVAYLFAHNAGGFGLTGTDNVISCGSFTLDGSNTAIVTLGYEPQWVMIKRTNSTGNWVILDNMRGLTTSGIDAALRPNTSGAETNGQEGIYPTATGFGANTGLSSSGDSYIYIAIRRGPMKVPTVGTSVFLPTVKPSSTNPQTVSTNFTVDLTWARGNINGSDSSPLVVDRLRGTDKVFSFSATAENTNANIIDLIYSNQYVNKTFTSSSVRGFGYAFSRAPNFFDEVCYTGNYANPPTQQVLTHNLGVTPELIIGHNRTDGSSYSYSATTGANYYLDANSSSAANGPRTDMWGTPTSTTFTVKQYTNNSGNTYVAYLFATCLGVSKVGSYSGTGATQTISCGFTGGARFVLIKRTDSTGDWVFWDTARGMVSGTDYKLALNVGTAESNANWVYTTTGGFEIVTTDANVNASGGTYIFLAIA